MKNILRWAIAAGSITAFTAGITSAATEMVTLCHATGSEENPYELITVSVNGLHGHETHEGDLIPAPNPECNPEVPPEV